MPASQASSSDLVVLLASTTDTATSAGTAAMPIYSIKSDVQFFLNVTAAATAAGDKLDVYIQGLVSGTPASGVWCDIVHFTQVAGNGGAKKFMAHVNAGQAEAMFEFGSALAAGSIRNIIGDYWRVRYDVTNVSAPSFTFSVTAMPV